MTPHERALKKELLLMKGEALRVKLRMELKLWQRPLANVADGVDAWKEAGTWRLLSGVLAALMPSRRLRSLLRNTSRALIIWRAARRIWSHR
ncbi:hypothetical protein QU481_11280 [Crenobacter sp. SG2303]|uniref:Cell division protein FtsH n=1 Tax=Crenobacter oryzisoli TaxID=3056844 RepID=A0ABT7XPI0_9NEIS|nr:MULTISPECIES: hypothetical protein [unclassified Crenobacter]MDN0075474.1 hypothetical protein [Crenobacter sp. SG2303]MDN0081458.1 hypothetical protein [Crenobacter sp. SG2305]